MELLGVDREFTRRYLNEGFSGGEKKRCEILQMAILKPLVAVMDETDSGLDIDALRTVAERRQDDARPGPGHPDHHPLPADPELHQAGLRPHHAQRPRGREGGSELAGQLEDKGYDWVREKHDGARGGAGLMEALTAQAPPRPRRRRHPGRLPAARARDRGAAGRLPRQRRHVAEAGRVIEAMDTYYRRSNANIHRTIHQLAAEATELYEGGRERVARLIGARPRRPSSSATRPRRSTWCASRWGRANVAPGDVCS